VNAQLLLVEPRGHATGKFQRLKVASRLHAQSDVRAAMLKRSVYSLWIAPSEPAMALLLSTLPRRPISEDRRLLSLERARGEAQNLVHAHFRFVVSAGDGVRLSPIAELIEVLGSDKRADLFIGGVVLAAQSALLLYRGNLEPITVPFNWFASRPGSPDPEVTQFAITDYGQTVRLGDYEAAADAILYEFDEDYRHRAKKRRLEKDESIGGSIRRLRLQKGLRQSDFPGVTAKEIARIEHGKVKKPHRETLQEIADRTGTTLDQLHSF
jgi:hypothetical protein